MYNEKVPYHFLAEWYPFIWPVPSSSFLKLPVVCFHCCIQSLRIIQPLVWHVKNNKQSSEAVYSTGYRPASFYWCHWQLICQGSSARAVCCPVTWTESFVSTKQQANKSLSFVQFLIDLHVQQPLTPWKKNMESNLIRICCLQEQIASRSELWKNVISA